MEIPEQIFHLIPFQLIAELIVTGGTVGVITVVDTVVTVVVLIVLLIVVLIKFFVLNCKRRRARCFVHHRKGYPIESVKFFWMALFWWWGTVVSTEYGDRTKMFTILIR